MIVPAKKKHKKNRYERTAKARFVHAANYVKRLWLADQSWPPDEKLIQTLCWLTTARAEVEAVEQGVKDAQNALLPFSPGCAIRLPGGGSFITTMPVVDLGARIAVLLEGARPFDVEVYAVASHAATLVAGSLADAYEAGIIRSCWLYAVDTVRGCWTEGPLHLLLRSVAEEVIRAGGAIKAYMEECGEEGGLDVLRLFKKGLV